MDELIRKAEDEFQIAVNHAMAGDYEMAGRFLESSQIAEAMIQKLCLAEISEEMTAH